ncbi:hypothetical protein O6H91_22G052200 [Diphasiastrum complanatum]|uniref:Uncharacterized protein n=1 Tax=Diphasiastrum complanatum TaxID=34168 RepID=A0ACC2AGT8_DIPCM|nr:hypothetical protein O6H91_22G052200 [Diphasiastrum complanatum]
MMSWRACRPAFNKLVCSLTTQRYAKSLDSSEGFKAVLLHQSEIRPRYIQHMPIRFQIAHVRCTNLVIPHSFKCVATQTALLSTHKHPQENADKGITRQDEDPFDTLTDRIPERPVSVAEGASYGLVILAGLAVAATAAYAVFKELILEPKEYKIFNKALDRVQHDSQVMVRIGTPITGYGQESRNRAARQRISNRTWTDEDGVERVEVVFFIRGPQGAGKVHSEMFKDKADKNWKFTYLIVDVMKPTPVRLMLESYVPT